MLRINRPDLVCFESALFRTTTTLLTGPGHLLLVDPNWLPIEIDVIRRYAEMRTGRRECYLLFTHSDYDHIIGYGQFSHFTVMASRAFVDQPKRAEILQEIRDFDEQYYISRNYPVRYPTVDIMIDEPVRSIQLGDEAYEIFRAPGHTEDSIVVLNRTRGILIAGDYLSNVEFPYVYDSVDQYRRTLYLFDRLFEIGNIRLLIPGHGDPTDDPEEMRQRLTDARRYLDDLEYSVRSGQSFDLARLFRRYRFPKVMQSFHAANRDKMIEHVRQNPVPPASDKGHPVD